MIRRPVLRSLTRHRPVGPAGQRALQAEIADLDELIKPLVVKQAPQLVARHRVGPDTAAALLVAAGDNPGRLRSEASFARLCGVAPIPATSGKTHTRHRLHRGGDRLANAAPWRVVMTRMSSDPKTRRYVERRLKECLSKREIMRCLKRYFARELYAYLPRNSHLTALGASICGQAGRSASRPVRGRSRSPAPPARSGTRRRSWRPISVPPRVTARPRS
jgi:transposase